MTLKRQEDKPVYRGIQLWHKLSFVAVGWILSRMLPEVILMDIFRDIFGSMPEIINYFITIAPALIPIGSLALVASQIYLNYRKGRKANEGE